MSARMFGRLALATAVMIALLPGLSRAQSASRVYLLAADTGHLYYSVDPGDPEAALSTINRRCPARTGLPIPTQPCSSGLDIAGRQHLHTLLWMPGSIFRVPASWFGTNPLRFHLELDVDTPFEHTVHLGVLQGAQPIESAPAREVAPGVWEGTISSGTLSSSGDPVNLLYVRVRTPAPEIRLTMRTAGASYLELPQAANAVGVPELLAGHTYRPAPSSYSTPQRRFWFNDGAWEAASFKGDLTAARQFQAQLPARAEMVIAWVEAFATPFVYDVARGREPDARKITNTPVISLFQGSDELAHGGNNGATGRGGDAIAVTGVGAGSLTLEVRPPQLGDHSYPYTAHILAIYGPRTLERMRWQFHVDHEGIVLPSARTPVGIACPQPYEVVPTTNQTTTLSVDLDWDSETPGMPRFTPQFSLPGFGSGGCGGMGAGDRVRLTVPGQRVWRLGAAPAVGTTVVSWRDTVFEMDVRYAYSPPPAA